MDFENKYVLKGKSQHWIYNGGCEYDCEVHRGKVEWHHPCSEYPEVGLNLCELHHSIILGRKKRNPSEIAVNKTLPEMREELHRLELSAVTKVGLTLSDIDKH